MVVLSRLKFSLEKKSMLNIIGRNYVQYTEISIASIGGKRQLIDVMSVCDEIIVFACVSNYIIQYVLKRFSHLQ